MQIFFSPTNHQGNIYVSRSVVTKNVSNGLKKSYYYALPGFNGILTERKSV